MKNGLHKEKDEGSLPNFPLNTFVLDLIRKSRVLSQQSKSKVGGTCLPRFPISTPILLFSTPTYRLRVRFRELLPGPDLFRKAFRLGRETGCFLGVDRVTGLCEDAGGESSSLSPELP